MQFPEIVYSVPIEEIELSKNIKIAFHQDGSGDYELIFVHGLATNLQSFSKLIPQLKDNFKCFAIDLPGYGKSVAGTHSADQKFYSEVIKNFIKKMNLKNPVLVGNSMGGQISFSTEINFPGTVKKMILLAPAGIEIFSNSDKEWIKKNFNENSFTNLSEKQIRASYAANFFIVPDDVEILIEERLKLRELKNFHNFTKVVVNSLYGLLEQPVHNNLKNIKSDTLIILAKNDRFIPNTLLHPDMTVKGIGELAKQLNPNFKIITLNNCGHLIPFEKPEATTFFIKEFLKS